MTMLQRFRAAALLAALTCAFASAQAAYTFTDLGALGGTRSSGIALNKAGIVVGEASQPLNQDNPPQEPTRAAKWAGPSPTDLGTLGGPYGRAMGINDAGKIVGQSGLAGGNGTHATLWDGASVVDLGTLGGTQSDAQAINKAGVIVGAASIAGNAGNRAVRWRHGKIKALKALGGRFSRALAISDTGIIVGWSEAANGRNHAVMWNGTEFTDLGKDAYAQGVNSAGQVVGYRSGEGYAHATLWVGGTAKDLGSLGGPQSVANGINDNGAIVGRSSYLPGSIDNHAAMWMGDTVIDLNDQLDQATRDAGWVLVDARAINIRGAITGTARNTITGVTHGFLLSP